MTTPTAKQLRRELRDAGFANAAIDAVWPQWWSSDADSSLAARSELLFTVARRLGMTPSSLSGGEPVFVWRDSTKYKNLSTADPHQQEILAAFGSAVARTMIELVDPPADVVGMPPETIRDVLLASAPVVGAGELVTFCWSVGVPVAQLRVFPLTTKRMHAMSCSIRGRHAVLLGIEYAYAARYAYVIAHEIGHIALGHLHRDGTLLDIDDPLTLAGRDSEEAEADRFALTVLTGRPDLEVLADQEEFTGVQLAAAALERGPELGIDPGVLVLALGYQTRRWDVAMAALKRLAGGAAQPWREINRIAADQLQLQTAPYADREYLRPVLGLD